MKLENYINNEDVEVLPEADSIVENDFSVGFFESRELASEIKDLLSKYNIIHDDFELYHNCVDINCKNNKELEEIQEILADNHYAVRNISYPSANYIGLRVFNNQKERYIESFLDNVKETILIPTGLYGKDDLSIFDSLSGQLSDGMGENSPRMSKFYQYMDFVLDENDQVMIRVPKNYGGYFGGEANPQWFKTWIANHLKQLVKEYIKYNDGEGSRDCTTRFDGGFHEPTPEIRDVYRVYDKLLGRKDRVNKYSYIEGYEYNPDIDEKKVDVLISGLFDHESLYEEAWRG